MRGPSRLRARAPSWLRTMPIAHRGLHDVERPASCPENSLAAFEAAARAGHPVELDVHLTADGEAVVFHDETLQRMTGRPGRVAEHTLSQLKALHLLDGDATVPSLDDVLACIHLRVPALIELKSPGSRRVGALEQAVCDALRLHRGDHAVQSFNPWSMVWMRRHAPDVPRGMLSGRLRDEGLPPHQIVALEHLLLAPVVMPDFIGYELAALPHWAPSAWRRLGRPLVAWTIRDAAGLRRARALADNVIFEGVVP